MKPIDIKSITLNPFYSIGDDWILLAAGDADDHNAMTVSWAHMGYIWNRPTAIAYVRPQRYTKAYMDREELFTLSRFAPEYKKTLGYLGTHSGRDGDKIAASGLTAVSVDGTTGFKEAELTLVCRKLYRAPITREGFIDESIVDKCYPSGDFHDLYIGEIIGAYDK